MPDTLFCYDKDHFNVWANKILIAAELYNVQVKVDKMTDELAKRFPLVTCFLYQSDSFSSSDCDAVMLHISQCNYLSNLKVCEFMNLAKEVHLVMKALVYPSLGLIFPDKNETAYATEHMNEVFVYLNKILSASKFLCGNTPNISDISMFCELLPLYENVMTEELRQKYPSVERYVDYCAHLPQFEKHIGDIQQCEKAATFNKQLYDKIKGADNTTSGKAPKKSGGKEKSQPKKTSVKEAKTETKQDDAKEEPKPPKRSWMASLPDTAFDFEEWKRTYNNTDVEKEALPYLWSHYDPQNMSFWFGEYKYNEDLDMGFKVNNYVNGFCSRIEKLDKVAFGVFYIAGTGKNGPGNYELTCVWMFRGNQLAFELDHDFGQDSDLFTYKKLDHTAPQNRKMIEDYFMLKDNIRPFPKYNSHVF